MIDIELVDLTFRNSFIDIVRNHNETINTFRTFINQNKKCPSVLVHFDTHGDIHLNNDIEICNSGNWINYAVLEFGIDEIFWVVPNYLVKNHEYRQIYEQKQNLFKEHVLLGFDEKSVNLDILNTAEFFFNTEKKEIISPGKISHINDKCEDFCLEKIVDTTLYKKLTINILTIENIQVLQNREFLLSVDSDYFCNSGFDTSRHIGNSEINSTQLYEEFNYFLTKIKEAHLKPICTSLSLSPIYFPSKFKDDISTFYSKIKSCSCN